MREELREARIRPRLLLSERDERYRSALPAGSAWTTLALRSASSAQGSVPRNAVISLRTSRSCAMNR